MTHHLKLRHWALLGSAVALAPLLASCSDDDSADQLTEAQFLEQGNGACAAAEEVIDQAEEAAFGDLEGEPDAATITEFADVVATQVQAEIDAIDALVPPEELEADVDELLTVVREELAQMEADVEEDPIAFASSEEDPFAEANAKAGELGLTQCDNS